MINFEKNIIKIVKNNTPSVVSVNVFKNKKSSKKDYGDYVDGGSGFIVDSSGIIVTSAHVIHRDGLYYEISTNDDKKFRGQLLGIDYIHDIAFIKIPARNKLKQAKLGDSSKLKIGQCVISMGNALGIFPHTATMGIISGLSRSIKASGKDMEESLHGLIQTDASVNPGESGGPLIDSSGKVIGMNSAISPNSENISFAIPINIIKEDISDIKKHGKIKKPFIGIKYIFVNENIAKKIGGKINQGILIMSPFENKKAVIKNSPAYKAGLKEGDIITHINKKEIVEEGSFTKILEEEIKKSSKINLSVIRGSRNINKDIKIN